MTLILFLFVVQVYALPPVEPIYAHIAGPKNGIHLRSQASGSPEGGQSIAFQIVNGQTKVLKSFEVSNTLFESHSDKNPHAEKISVTACKGQLKKLEAAVARYKKIKVKLAPNNCEAHRAQVVESLR